MYKIINKKKLYLTMAADCLGWLLCLPKVLLARKRPINPEEIQEILLIRTAYIGDVVMALPLLAPLRRHFPNARITFLTSSCSLPLLENNPFVDEILTVDPFWFYPTTRDNWFDFIKAIRKKSFDLVIETRGDIREILGLVLPIHARHKIGYACGGGGYLLTDIVPYTQIRHRIDFHLDIARHLGCPIPAATDWNIYLHDTEEQEIEELLHKEVGPRWQKILAIHPGSRKPLKCWPAERYAALADRLADKYDITILLVGAPDERPLVECVANLMHTPAINLAAKTSLRQLAGVLRRCTLFVCNDSSPMHIAAAVKTPVVAIFGPSKSKETGTWGDSHRVVEKDFPCRYQCDEDVCHYSCHNQCMQDISVEDVLAAVRENHTRLTENPSSV